MATPETKINRSDLQFFPSERLTDNDDGGGMPLGTPISGEANELFNPISSIARVNGAFFARLVYAGVQRIDDEPLIGSHMAITNPPTDSTVSYLLFRATKFGELREEILKRIEAYSVGTIESRMTLLSTQSQYSKLIQAYQRPGEPLPLVGDVYCLRQNKAGFPKHEQYIQVTRVTSEDRTFTSKASNKDFTRTVVKLEISSKLEADFIGADYPDESYIDNPCKIRETAIADAAQYYGIKPLAAAILKESMTIQVPSLMEKIVPTNQIETKLLDLTAAGQRQTLFDAARTGADGIVTLAINKSHSAGSISNIYLGNAAIPDSVVIATASGQVTDKGGTLTLNDKAIGAIDYGRGEAIISDPTFSGYITSIKFRPAAAELRVADTARIDITVNNSGSSHSLTLDPPPAVGSLIMSFMSQGRWYDLRDDGTGALRGASAAHGSGSINYVTGTASISTGELPDIGSAILLAWSTRARYFNRSGGTTKAKMLLQLSQDADPASISLAWDDGAAKTATADATGKITGDWTGAYNDATRQIHIDAGVGFNHPAGVLDIAVSYSNGEKTALTFNAPLRDSFGKITVDLGDKPIKPNTFRLRWNLLIEDYEVITTGDIQTRSVDPYKTVRDDGNGNLLDETGINVGTIDYAARKATFNPDTTVIIPKTKYSKTKIGEQIVGTSGTQQQYRNVYRNLFIGFEYVPAGASMPIDESGLVEVWFYDTTAQTTTTEQLTSGDIEIDLLPKFAEVVAPSSLNLNWGGRTYFDKLGTIYTNLNTSNGSASVAGTMDYGTGRVILKDWDWSDGAAPVIVSLATSIDGNPVDAVTFRTPSSPIRPGSMQVRATAVDGTKVNGKANFGGVIATPNMTGKVDAEYGVTDLQFGAMVTAAGNEEEYWYTAEAVVDGMIWQPKHVFAETITYNADAYSYLPIDSTIVKIDTVRLPQDGRIPIFRRGDTIIIGNRLTDDIGSAHTGGQTVQLSRANVDRICVTDADDKPVNAELWDYDLDAGSITWKTPLDLSSYKMPLSIMHAQEERNRILKADIDGTLTLIFPTKRDYALADTYVSSVLICGDLQVRVSVPFTQRNWNNVWQDTPVGEQLLNKLNLTDYPMVLTDDGAIKERWMIKMTGTSNFELYGETLGFVMRGDTLTDLAPIRPATGKPYFTIPKEAFGADAPWASQDIIRFNTWGTLLPTWVLCAVQPSDAAPVGIDGFTQCLYGDTTEIIV